MPALMKRDQAAFDDALARLVLAACPVPGYAVLLEQVPVEHVVSFLGGSDVGKEQGIEEADLEIAVRAFPSLNHHEFGSCIRISPRHDEHEQTLGGSLCSSSSCGM